MKQAQTSLTVTTPGQALVEITAPVVAWVAEQAIDIGLLTVFCRHTSASLLIQENADPDVRHDLEVFLRRLVPEQSGQYIHTLEGPDDMPAHIRTALTATTLAVPVQDGRPVLGTWQGLYVFEHRARPHRRTIVLHLIGE